MLRAIFQLTLLQMSSSCCAHAFERVLLHVLQTANSCCVLGLSRYCAGRAPPIHANAAVVVDAPCVHENLMVGQDRTPNTHEPPRLAQYPLEAQPTAAEAVAVAKHQGEEQVLSCTDLVDGPEPLATLVLYGTGGMAAPVAAAVDADAADDDGTADGANGDALDTYGEDVHTDRPRLDGECPVPETACQLTPSRMCSAEWATRSLRGCPTLQEQGRLEGSGNVRRR